MNYASLVKDIELAAAGGLTLDLAERLAGKALAVQNSISEDLKAASLDARMRKSGVKAVKAAVYLAGVQAADKKPSDVLLSAQVDSDPMVMEQQRGLDTAETLVEELERHWHIAKEFHIFVRGIAKGSSFG